MAPIRRYLRISKHSALECRIFLENPADEARWLLNDTDPALRRIFEAVKPYVLPKLREENERARSKGKKKKSVKDVVTQDDFEVSIFLTEIQTRHSLLAKNKTFQPKSPLDIGPGQRMSGGNGDMLHVLEESDDEGVSLAHIPRAENRDRDTEGPPDHARLRDDDTKDKMGFKTTYDGFSIWGRVLCLFVERKGGPAPKKSGVEANAPGLMQDWIASTQEQQDDGV